MENNGGGVKKLREELENPGDWKGHIGTLC
jgi:hypothetical protein